MTPSQGVVACYQAEQLTIVDGAREQPSLKLPDLAVRERISEIPLDRHRASPPSPHDLTQSTRLPAESIDLSSLVSCASSLFLPEHAERSFHGTPLRRQGTGP